MPWAQLILAMRNILFILLFVAAAAAYRDAQAGDYLILDLAGADDPYHPAARRLTYPTMGRIHAGRRLARISGWP
jgi:hypothetical protein